MTAVGITHLAQRTAKLVLSVEAGRAEDSMPDRAHRDVEEN